MSKRAEWTRRVAEMRASGKTIKAWCREQGISYSTMRSWLRKLAEKPVKAEVPGAAEWVEAIAPDRELPFLLSALDSKEEAKLEPFVSKFA